MPTVGPFAALGYRVELNVEDPALAAELARVLDSLASPATLPATPYEVTPSERVLSEVMWHLNAEAVASSPGHLLLHAGAVAVADRAVLLPASMECGKTTLVAGLVRRGLDYLTDETVAIDPVDITVLAYPKPLSIDQGSWEVLADLRPRHDPWHTFQWQVRPDDIRPGCVARRPCRPALMIAPRYVAGAATRLTPMVRSEAVVYLAENSFNFRSDGARWLPVAGAVIAQCDCYRLIVGDLDDACRLVLDAVDAVADATVPA